MLSTGWWREVITGNAKYESTLKKCVVCLTGKNGLRNCLFGCSWGYFFVETGWGKLHNLDGFARRFAGWGIPHPYFNAALSAYTEFVGGMLTMFGIRTRPVGDTNDHQHAGRDTQGKF